MPGNGGNAREALSRARIYSAALTLIDREGLAAFGMRSLARELGVTAASLYYHFGSKEDLLSGLADRLYSQLRPSEREPEEPTDGLANLFVETLQVLRQHPNIAPLLMRHLVNSSVLVGDVRELLREVSDTGPDKAANQLVVKNMLALLLGHSLMVTWSKAGGRLGTCPPIDPEYVTDTQAIGEDGDVETLMRGMEALLRGLAKPTAS